MKFNGCELVTHVRKEQNKTGQAVDYYFFVVSETTKEDYLNSYFDFLKNCKKIPLDILNSKIEILDIIYVPLTLYDVLARTDVRAEIGKFKTIKEFGGLEYKQSTKRHEVFYNYKTETDWHFEDFSVYGKASGIFCNNLYFKNIFNSAFQTQEEMYKKFISFTYTDIAPSYLNKLKGGYNETLPELRALMNTISDDAEKQIDKELKERGDTSRNVKSFIPKGKEGNDIAIAQILVPVGYIKYSYLSRSYSYIKILSSKGMITLKEESPEEIFAPAKCNSPARNIFFIYIVFWILFFAGYWFISNHFQSLIINEKVINICTKLIIGYAIFQVIDWFCIYYRESSLVSEYENKRTRYIYNLFDKHLYNLKQLVLKTDKSYKES